METTFVERIKCVNQLSENIRTKEEFEQAVTHLALSLYDALGIRYTDVYRIVETLRAQEEAKVKEFVLVNAGRTLEHVKRTNCF
jgi:predicted transcriptional regulator